MSRRRQQGMTTIGEINVTPLTDLTFLLLITFIITAPILEFTVNVNTPELNATPPNQETPHRIVTLDAGGKLFLEQQAVTEDSLEEALARAVVASPKLQVFIRADEARPYGEVMNIMKLVKHAGIQDVSLVTKEEEKAKGLHGL